MDNIEVEVRTFINKEQYNHLIAHFSQHADIDGVDDQETYYFSGEHDLRIQRNSNGAKMILKKGKIHDDSREEIEVEVPREQFDLLESFFINLGYVVEIKWFRKRHLFYLDDITVTVDYTKGYGYVLELEKLTDEEHKEETHKLLLRKLEELKIPLTPKEEFDKKYVHYKEHWKELLTQD